MGEGTANKIRLLLADDHELLRKSMCAYLPTLDPNIEIISEAADGVGVLRLCGEQPPDIVILDLRMPQMDGFQVLRLLKTLPNVSGIKVIVLSAHYNEFYFTELARLGAAAYLPKNVSPEEMVIAINTVHKDGYYFAGEFEKRDIASLVKLNVSRYVVSQNAFSERELQIVDLLAQGLHVKQVGERLSISHNTVKFHVKEIYEKTAVNNVVSLVKYAIRVGLVDVEDSGIPRKVRL